MKAGDTVEVYVPVGEPPYPKEIIKVLRIDKSEGLAYLEDGTSVGIGYCTVVTTPQHSSDVEEAARAYADGQYSTKIRSEHTLELTLTDRDAHEICIDAFEAGWQASFQSVGVGKSLKECKDEVFSKLGYNSYQQFLLIPMDDLPSEHNDWDFHAEKLDEAAEMYAQSNQVKEGEGWIRVTPNNIPEAGKWVACLNMSDSGFINWVAKGRMNNPKTWNVKGAIGMTFQNSTPTHYMPLPHQLLNRR